jgi:hypothetical protein
MLSALNLGITRKGEAGMKISGVGTTRGTVARGGARKSAGGGGFKVDAGTESTAGKPVQGVSATNEIGALLSVQEMPDATDERSRGLAHGRDILRELEHVRHALLLGTIPKARLERLMRMLDRRRDTFTDPKLEMIIQEIEVRAAVELAKFEKGQKI